MNVTDIVAWSGLAVAFIAVVVIGFGARRTGYGLLLASLAAGVVMLAAKDDTTWLTWVYGAAAGWVAFQFGKELRKGGAK